MPTIDAATRHDLTDAQWRLLEPLLPTPTRRGRPRRWPARSLVDGVRHRTRVGCPRRDVPADQARTVVQDIAAHQTSGLATCGKG